MLADWYSKVEEEAGHGFRFPLGSSFGYRGRRSVCGDDFSVREWWEYAALSEGIRNTGSSHSASGR